MSTARPACCADAPDHTRLLVVPGLRDSGPAHWQTWLQDGHPRSLRVQQADWLLPDLDRWARTLIDSVASDPHAHWIVAAHSFGCLALARAARLQPCLAVEAALLVAPASPGRFDAAPLLGDGPLPFPSTLVFSETDPWMTSREALRWAAVWGSAAVALGDAGHVNTESGFGPFPFARRWVLGREQRFIARRRRSGLDLAA